MAEATDKTVEVTITVVVDESTNEQSCKVIPGEVEVEKGNKIKFTNETPQDVSLLFSEVCLFIDPEDKSTSSTLKITPEEKSKSISVRNVQRGIYPYAVYCNCISDFATASSMPIIIIRK